jgi:WD40 repeat protein
LIGHEHFVTGISIHNDSRKIVSSSNDGSVRIWDLVTDEVLTKFKKCH